MIWPWSLNIFCVGSFCCVVWLQIHWISLNNIYIYNKEKNRHIKINIPACRNQQKMEPKKSAKLPSPLKGFHPSLAISLASAWRFDTSFRFINLYHSNPELGYWYYESTCSTHSPPLLHRVQSGQHLWIQWLLQHIVWPLFKEFPKLKHQSGEWLLPIIRKEIVLSAYKAFREPKSSGW